MSPAKVAVLILGGALSWSCGELGKVDQGRVIAFDGSQGLVTLIGASATKNTRDSRYDVLPPVTVLVPRDPEEMGPAPEAGKLMEFDLERSVLLVFDAGRQSFRRIGFSLIHQEQNVGVRDPRVAGKQFPVLDRTSRTITIYSPWQRLLAKISVAGEYWDLPEDTWRFGDEVRYYYKDRRQALRMMNVTKTDISQASG